MEKKVVSPIFERGFYWAHSENILLAMLASQEADIRAHGVAKIFAIRDAEKLSGALLSDRGFESRMTSLWVSQWFCIANGSRKLKP